MHQQRERLLVEMGRHIIVKRDRQKERAKETYC